MSDDTRAARERAEEKFPWHLPGAPSEQVSLMRSCYVDGFLARDAEPTTVTAEQIEQSAKSFCRTFMGAYIWEEEWDQGPDEWRDYAKFAFRAAGFRIEGDPA